MQDAGYKMQDAGYKMQDAGYYKAGRWVRRTPSMN